MVRNCYHLKAGSFCAAAYNLLVGGLSLGAAIYNVVLNKNGRIGLMVIMFILSALLIYNGILLIVGIVMVNREYVVLYLVLNSVNWLVTSVIVLKEISSEMTNWTYVGLCFLLIFAWFLQSIVYLFYKNMHRRNLTSESEFIEVIDKIVSTSS